MATLIQIPTYQQFQEKVGDVNNLSTTTKTSLVDAINKLKVYVDTHFNDYLKLAITEDDCHSDLRQH